MQQKHLNFFADFLLDLGGAVLYSIGIGLFAQNAGFADYSNFIRVFKKYVGISPKKYQLQHIRRLEVAVVGKTADFEP